MVPLSHHLTGRFLIFHMQVGMMWIFCSFFSLFTKTARSHAKRNNVQCKRLFYFCFPTRHCFNSRCTFALLRSCTCVGVKMRRIEGHFWESIIYKIPVNFTFPEVWTVRTAAASAPWRAPQHSSPKQGRFTGLTKTFEMFWYFSEQAGWLRDPVQSHWTLWAGLFSAH